MHTPDVASDRKGGLSGTATSAVPKAIHGIPTSIDALQNVPKPIHSAPMSVQAVTDQKLPFSVHYIVGLGYNGELILADRVSERYLYKMQHNGEEYKEVWKMESPVGIKFDCDKQLSIDGHIFLQGDIDKTIVCYDESLRKKKLNCMYKVHSLIASMMKYSVHRRHRMDGRLLFIKLLWKQLPPVVF